MNELKTCVEGEYLLKVHSPRGDREYRFKNLITDAGLNRIFVGNVFGQGGAADYVQIGTGNATPAATDTTLQNRVASTPTIQSALSQVYVAGPPDYHQLSVTYRFALGALNTASTGNLAEVGIGWASAGSLWSRALITNSGGSPITLSVLSDEQLDVTYVCRVYPPQTDATGSITLDGASYSYVMRPAGVTNTAGSGGPGGWRVVDQFVSGFTGTGYFYAYSDTIKARTSVPSVGSIFVGGVGAWQTYVSSSYQRVLRFTVDLNVGNVAGGIQSVVGYINGSGFTTHQAYQVEFTPKIPKDGTKRLTLDFVYRMARRP